MKMALTRFLLAGVALSVVASGCGGGAIAADAPTACDAQTLKVPSIVSGFNVVKDPTATKKILGFKGTRSYVRDAQVFALRSGTKKDSELQAVFQVVRLTADARPEDRDFRKKIVAGMGGNSDSPEKRGDNLVYRAIVNSQVIYLWFNSCFMETIAIRLKQNNGAPSDTNTILDEALKLKPARL